MMSYFDYWKLFLDVGIIVSIFLYLNYLPPVPPTTL